MPLGALRITVRAFVLQFAFARSSKTGNDFEVTSNHLKCPIDCKMGSTSLEVRLSESHKLRDCGSVDKTGSKHTVFVPKDVDRCRSCSSLKSSFCRAEVMYFGSSRVRLSPFRTRWNHLDSADDLRILSSIRGEWIGMFTYSIELLVDAQTWLRCGLGLPLTFTRSSELR